LINIFYSLKGDENASAAPAKAPMADLSDFQQYYKLADFLIEESSEEQLAECARLLALNLAHYQAKFGEISLDESLSTLDGNREADASHAVALPIGAK
jgi:hypothetical protein